jgi:hypothetical protein
VISTNHGVLLGKNPFFVDDFSQPTQPMAMARKGPEADALEAKSDPNGMLRIWRPSNTRSFHNEAVTYIGNKHTTINK